MDTSTSVELIFGLLGGLALFIFGMQTMSAGLSSAVGDGMRTLLGKATRNRLNGLGLGTVIGGIIQSSASVVLFIGFINAGLMTLTQSIAPILGANIGTTLSVQLISLKLSDYCLPAIFIGLMLHMISRKRKFKYGGKAVLGFGLLFLGMVIMGDSIKPHREILEDHIRTDCRHCSCGPDYRCSTEQRCGHRHGLCHDFRRCHHRLRRYLSHHYRRKRRHLRDGIAG
jgi:Na+/phosphate symporter